MNIQLWYCDACEVEFAVSDGERKKVTCTGGHPTGRPGKLTADHWPSECRFVGRMGVDVGVSVADVWPEIVLPEGERFGLEDARKAASSDEERATRLTQYGWPGGVQ